MENPGSFPSPREQPECEDYGNERKSGGFCQQFSYLHSESQVQCLTVQSQLSLIPYSLFIQFLTLISLLM